MKISKKKVDTLLLSLLFISLYLGRVNVNVGIAIKPYMIISGLILVYILKDFYIRKLYIYEAYMIFFILIYSLTALRFSYPEKHIMYILAFGLLLIFYFVIRCYVDKFEIKVFEKYFVICSNMCMILSLLYYLMGIVSLKGNFYGNNVLKSGLLLDRGIPRMIGFISLDPNIFVFFITLIFIYTLNDYKKLRNKVGLSLSSLCIVLSFSRGAIVSIIIAVIISFMIERNIKKNLKIFFLILISMIFITCIASYFSIDIVSIINSRFESIKIDGGSGRSVLWKNALTSFANNPIFGIGINSTTSYGMEFYGNSHYVHNTILEVLSEGGVIGFALFLLWFSSIFISCWKIYKYNKETKFILVTFIAMLLQMIFLSILYNEAFYFFLVVLSKYYSDFGVNNRKKFFSKYKSITLYKM